MKKFLLFILTIATLKVSAQLPNNSQFEFEFTAGSLTNTSASGANDLSGSVTTTADRFGNSNNAIDVTNPLNGSATGTPNILESTLCFWMKHAAQTTGERILQMYGAGGNGYRVEYDQTNKLYVNVQIADANNFSSGGFSRVDGLILDDDIWHHIAVRTTTYGANGIEVEVFVDNVSQAISLNPTFALTTPITEFVNNANFVISPLNNYSGDLDDIFFYKTALTDAEIGQIYNYPNAAPCTVNIPDANFKSYLVGNTDINTNGDTEIQCSEASSFSGQIFCPNQSITDVTGIEAFTTLDRFICAGNPLNSIDVSSNINLTDLNCSSTSISNVDLSENTELVLLDCSNNSISSLDLSSNAALESLLCGSNQIGSLDVTANPLLLDLRFDNNSMITSINLTQCSLLTRIEAEYTGLTSIDISNSPLLEVILIGYCSLSNLDVSNNTALQIVECQSNQITSLDFSLQTSLFSLICSSNQLSSLNLQNGNNTAMSNGNLYAAGNIDLTCIQVDDVTYSTDNWTNAGLATFSTLCTGCTIDIPDANFKAYLVGNTDINTNGDTEIQCDEAASFSGSIWCANLNITDLTGIEAFVNSTILNCSNNLLTSLDVSANTALIALNCRNTTIESLDISANTALTELYCYNNSSLVMLNAANGNNPSFLYFLANNTPNLSCITVDDVSWSTTAWTVLNNSIDAAASFSTNCGVCNVDIPDANFKAYLVGTSAINTNGDTEIQCDEATNYTGLIDCGVLGISDMTGIEAFINLTDLRCHTNNISVLDLSSNAALTILGCAENSISALDLTNNTALTILNCANNDMANLDITSLNGLTSLKCYNNQLTNLNAANGNNTNFTVFQAYNNPNLTCIGVDDVAYSTANWTDIDAGASFSTDCASVGVIEATQRLNLNVYPNPTTGKVTLSASEQIKSIEIYDLRGQLVGTFNNTNVLNINNLTNGIYLAKVLTATNNPVMQKLIKE